MRLDWVPVSAAAFVTGVMALAFAALLAPEGSGAVDTLEMVQQQNGRWLVVAVIYFIAAVGLTRGLPSVTTLFDHRARILGLVSVLVLAMGFLGTAGYSMVMVFFRALAITGGINSDALERATEESGLVVFLLGWVASFVIGELLLALALLRSRAVPRWVPITLVAHVACVVAGNLLPGQVARASVMLLAVAFAGVAIQAVARDSAARRG
jgi:uncharacterized membrane-anchored protein